MPVWVWIVIAACKSVIAAVVIGGGRGGEAVAERPQRIEGSGLRARASPKRGRDSRRGVHQRLTRRDRPPCRGAERGHPRRRCGRRGAAHSGCPTSQRLPATRRDDRRCRRGCSGRKGTQRFQRLVPATCRSPARTASASTDRGISARTMGCRPTTGWSASVSAPSPSSSPVMTCVMVLPSISSRVSAGSVVYAVYWLVNRVCPASRNFDGP